MNKEPINLNWRKSTAALPMPGQKIWAIPCDDQEETIIHMKLWTPFASLENPDYDADKDDDDDNQEYIEPYLSDIPFREMPQKSGFKNECITVFLDDDHDEEMMLDHFLTSVFLWVPAEEFQPVNDFFESAVNAERETC